jgi:hypothetical protein
MSIMLMLSKTLASKESNDESLMIGFLLINTN